MLLYSCLNLLTHAPKNMQSKIEQQLYADKAGFLSELNQGELSAGCLLRLARLAELSQMPAHDYYKRAAERFHLDLEVFDSWEEVNDLLDSDANNILLAEIRDRVRNGKNDRGLQRAFYRLLLKEWYEGDKKKACDYARELLLLLEADPCPNLASQQFELLGAKSMLFLSGDRGEKH